MFTANLIDKRFKQLNTKADVPTGSYSDPRQDIISQPTVSGTMTDSALDQGLKIPDHSSDSQSAVKTCIPKNSSGRLCLHKKVYVMVTTL